MQVECLHHLKEGKHHKHKVQRSGCKVQRSGHKVQRSGASISASRYGMQQQLQHATTNTTTTDHADMTNTARCSNHCNLREAGPTTHRTNLALTQVAVIAASCCVGHICMVGGGGGCSCMLQLLLHPVPTSTDAGPRPLHLVSRPLHLTS